MKWTCTGPTVLKSEIKTAGKGNEERKKDSKG